MSRAGREEERTLERIKDQIITGPCLSYYPNYWPHPTPPWPSGSGERAPLPPLSADVTPRRGGGGTRHAEAVAEAQAATVFRAFQRGRVYEAGRPGVSAPPGPPLSTLAARAFSQLDPEASPGDLDEEDFPRGAIATISSARDSPQIPGPAGPPSAHASPKGTVPTLLEKVHRYVWPKEREECPQVAFEPKPCREIPITQWILRRVRRLPLFAKKKGNVGRLCRLG